jgi:hypothetical protein
MKRLLFVSFVLMLVLWFTVMHRARRVRPTALPRHEYGTRFVHRGQAKQRFFGVRGPLVPTKDPQNTVGVPVNPEAPALDEIPGPGVPTAPAVELADGNAPLQNSPLPVSAIQGATTRAETAFGSVPPQGSTVKGLISATEERAKDEARRKLQNEVMNWLQPEVSPAWSPPTRLLDAMILETRVRPVVKEYGTLYEAELKVDASSSRRAQLVELYDRELTLRRLTTLGGTLTFVLICLATISGYIRADEATKGYCTNRLRLLAAVGVGTAGAIIYRFLA